MTKIVVSCFLTFILTLLSSYLIYHFSRDSKQLQIITDTLSLVSLDDPIRENFSILFGDKPVDNITLYQLSITNTGNREITEHDIHITIPPSEHLAALKKDFIHTTISRQDKGKPVVIHLSFLNPRDTETIGIYTYLLKGDISNGKLFIEARGPGIQVETYDKRKPDDIIERYSEGIFVYQIMTFMILASLAAGIVSLIVLSREKKSTLQPDTTKQ